MWPDDRLPGNPFRADLLDADLVDLDAALERAGAAARRREGASTRVDRAFAADLRRRLVGATPARTVAALDAPAWSPGPLRPRLSARRQGMPSRWTWGLAAAALVAAVVAAGGGLSLERFAPVPSEGSPATSTLAPTPRASDAAVTMPSTLAPPVDDPTSEPTAVATARPTATPMRKPSPKPEPTTPAVGTMSLTALACPGAVVLDWGQPESASVDHYRVLRKAGGEVPATWPAAGATEVTSAASWDSGTTDGFDPEVGGGTEVSYRAFAFDAGGAILAVSQQGIVTAVSMLELGPISVANDGAGAITASWAASEVGADCFSYGKLVASPDNPDPSYLNGDPYLAVVGDPNVTQVSVTGLPSGKTLWVRYEMIRSTGTGKFVVARTDVRQVTIP